MPNSILVAPIVAAPILAAHWVLGIAAFYAAIGIVVAVAFVLFGATRALGASSVTLGARFLILPGAAALWPLVLRRWRASAP